MRLAAPLLALGLLAACTSAATEPPPEGSGAAAPTDATGATGTTATGATGIAPPAPGELADAACSIPHEQLLRVWRGTDGERSGQVVFVPAEPNFVGTNFPHSGPWDYLQDVPLLWYGPGIVPPLGRVDTPATIADIAPTQARLLGFDFEAPDGRVLEEIPAPETPPSLSGPTPAGICPDVRLSTARFSTPAAFDPLPVWTWEKTPAIQTLSPTTTTERTLGPFTWYVSEGASPGSCACAAWAIKTTVTRANVTSVTLRRIEHRPLSSGVPRSGCVFIPQESALGQ